MNCHFSTIRVAIFFLLQLISFLLYGQQAWFADGYHGGIYGHYPMWQTEFMVDQLRENTGWAINLGLNIRERQ